MRQFSLKGCANWSNPSEFKEIKFIAFFSYLMLACNLQYDLLIVKREDDITAPIWLL
jgi:hypothetical protein